VAAPQVSIETATAAEADCLEEALMSLSIVRDGLTLSVAASDDGESMLGVLLRALEDCVTNNELAPLKIEVDEQRYVMYARADA
jgi:hypothetical protein